MQYIKGTHRIKAITIGKRITITLMQIQPRTPKLLVGTSRDDSSTRTILIHASVGSQTDLNISKGADELLRKSRVDAVLGRFAHRDDADVAGVLGDGEVLVCHFFLLFPFCIFNFNILSLLFC